MATKKPKGSGDLHNKDIMPPRNGSADTMARHATIRQQNMQSTPNAKFEAELKKLRQERNAFEKAQAQPKNKAPKTAKPKTTPKTSLYNRITGSGRGTVGAGGGLGDYTLR